ncbi:branched-chain amino acid ABC transporter permease [Halomicroarcula limicola]|uniref:Branched-chain amino acid ABC transporter permease n=1 Tax=Haloarcula limicola TaxID=1429915 RepID=A0A8J7Y2P8_9EURY|nr:branched-chain amino acid ABC transporter permease [Halomicroarcula limicola]MBV0922927.1 branched-chain amino acid ABC transporter permease [Halomicroarcula limicola]
MSAVEDVRERLLALPDAALVALFVLVIWLALSILAFSVGAAQSANLAAGFVGSVTVLIGAYALLTLALNLQWGYTGLFNIGVAGFMAVGAYTTAILTAPANPGAGGVPGFGLPLWFGLLGGMAMAALVGALAALPALRLRADYLAIVTVALSEIIRLFVNWQGVSEVQVLGKTFGTGGATGISFPAPDDVVADVVNGLGGPLVAIAESLGVSGPNVVNIAYGLALLALVVGAYWVLNRLAKSPFGRVLKAIREDETVTQSLGKDTRLFKIKAFMIGCALMGLAGALFRGGAGYISPAQFRPAITFYVFAALIIGGSGSNTGSVLGAATFSALLFYLPARLGEYFPTFGTNAPGNVVEAVAALGSLDPTPLLAYTISNVSTLRFVLIGVVLVYIIQNYPQGILGNRSEPATSVDLTRHRPADSGGDADE